MSWKIGDLNDNETESAGGKKPAFVEINYGIELKNYTKMNWRRAHFSFKTITGVAELHADIPFQSDSVFLCWYTFVDFLVAEGTTFFAVCGQKS